MDLAFYLQFWKQRKMFSLKSWFQTITCHSFLPQPIPGLDVYKEKLPVKLSFSGNLFFGFISCLSLPQETWAENRRVSEARSGMTWARWHWGSWKPMHAHLTAYRGSLAKLPRQDGRSGFPECTCLKGCWQHSKPISQFYCFLNGGGTCLTNVLKYLGRW